MAHSLAQIDEAISSITALNPTVASQLTTLRNSISQFLGTFDNLEQRFDALAPEDRAGDQQLQDLNDAARDQVGQIFAIAGFAYNVAGAIRFASLLLPESIAAVTPTQIAYAAAGQAGGSAFDAFLSATWDEISITLLPPLTQGTNDADILLGALNGGTTQLLGGNDIFVPNDVETPYWVQGGSGNDVIFGGMSGEDSLDGGDDNDTIIANHGAFEVSGDDGNDWIQIEGSGDNNIKGNNGADTLIGGAQDDALFGTNAPIALGSILAASPSDSDYLIGRGGADTVNGSIGNDFLIGDNFSDSDSTEEKALFTDFIAALDGKVSASGIAGNDTMIGYAGNDVIAGGGGNDVIYGDDGIQNITDGSGDDTLFGDAGNDTISGGGGNDLLYGGADDDELSGGAGSDRYYFDGAFGDDVVNDGSINADDRIIINELQVAGKAVPYDVPAGSYRFGDLILTPQSGGGLVIADGANSITLQDWNSNGDYGITLFNLPVGATVIAGTNDAEGLADLESGLSHVFYGFGGDDTITAAYGSDVIFGGAGAGADQISVGNNQTNLSDGGAVVYGEAGDDRIYFGMGDHVIYGGDGNDRLIFYTTDSGNSFIHGGAGDDVLGYFYSTLDFVVRDVTMMGGEGNDWLIDPFLHNDTLYGGTGYDTYVFKASSTQPQSHGHDVIVDEDGSGLIAYDFLETFDDPELTGRASYISANHWQLAKNGYLFTLALSGDDLRITSTIYTGQSITVKNFDDGDFGLTLGAKPQTFTGTGGNDTLTGLDNNDTLEGGAGDDLLYGDIGDGDSGADVLIGGLGSDTLTGGNGNDRYIVGQVAGVNEGLDRIVDDSGVIQFGETVLSGEAFYDAGLGIWLLEVEGRTFHLTYDGVETTITDPLEGGEGVVVEGFFGNFGAAPQPNAYLGSAGSETLTGSGDADTLFGYGSDDTLYGNAGLDLLLGGSGNDLLYGGADADTLLGGDGDDTLSGEGGVDFLDGGDGFDIVDVSSSTGSWTIDLAAGTGATSSSTEDILNFEGVIGSNQSDVIYGTEGTNHLFGNGGTDQLYGLGGNDTLDGGGSADYLDGGTGNDLLIGGDGDDTLLGGSGLDTFEGGDGFDVADYSYFTDHLAIDLASGGATAQGMTELLTGIEGIIGGTTDDTILGDSVANQLDGFTGNDVIAGGDGDDTLLGGDGDDTLDGGAGSDAMDGGDGFDTVTYVQSTSFVSIDLAANNHWSGDASWDSITNVEGVIGSEHHDYINGNAAANHLAGGLGNDTMHGGDGNDTIEAGDGDDYLTGGDGDDFIVGGAGSDYIDGGAGNDTVSYAASQSFVSVDLAANNHWSGDASWDSVINVENVIGSDYSDWIVGYSSANALTGGIGNDTLLGGDGNDTLDAGEGDDQLVGGDGDDLLIGGNGSDYLDGGAGSDTVSYAGSSAWVHISLIDNNQWNGDAAWDNILNVENVTGSAHDDYITGDNGANRLEGGEGADTLYGLAGDDIFVFSANSGADVIADFAGAGIAGGDVILLGASAGLADWAAVQAATSYDSLAETATIDFGNGNSLIVQGVTTAFQQGDFAWDAAA